MPPYFVNNDIVLPIKTFGMANIAVQITYI